MKSYSEEKIIELYVNTNKTMKEIANIVGNISSSTVKRVLIKNGVKIVPKGSHSHYSSISNKKQEIKDVEKLIELFNQSIPVKEIAETLGTSRHAVEREIKKLNLIRPKSMMSRCQYDSKKDETIINLYTNGKAPNEIAKIVGLSRGAVKNHLKHNNLELRGISEGLFNYNKKSFPKELAEYEKLYEMYTIQRLSKKDIANMLNVSPNVVERCLKKFGIKIRGNSECKVGLFVGEKHPNWKGGITTLYRRLRMHFKTWQVKDVIKRDGGKCQLCGNTHNLQVHHIRHFSEIFNEILSEHSNLDINNDKDKLYNIMINDSRLNDKNNLITYCKECHLFKIHNYRRKNHDTDTSKRRLDSQSKQENSGFSH